MTTLRTIYRRCLIFLSSFVWTWKQTITVRVITIQIIWVILNIFLILAYIKQTWRHMSPVNCNIDWSTSLYRIVFWYLASAFIILKCTEARKQTWWYAQDIKTIKANKRISLIFKLMHIYWPVSMMIWSSNH